MRLLFGNPWVENFVEKGLGRVIAEDNRLTMVIPMQDEFKKAQPEATERFLRAHKEALLYAATHQDQANSWFREPEVARQLSKSVVETTTAYDPQWGAKRLSDIRVSFSDSELERYLELGRRAGELKIYPCITPRAEKARFSRRQRKSTANLGTLILRRSS